MRRELTDILCGLGLKDASCPIMPTHGNNNSEEDFIPQTKRPKITPSPKAKRISKATSSNRNKNSSSTLLRYFSSQRDSTSAQLKHETPGAVVREQFLDADIAEAIRRSLETVDKLSNSQTSLSDGLTDETVERLNNAETERPPRPTDIASNHTNNEINDGLASDFLVQPEHYDKLLSLSPPSSIVDHSSEVEASMRQSEPPIESSLASYMTCRTSNALLEPNANSNPADDLSTVQILAEIARCDTIEWGEEDDEISAMMDEDFDIDVLVDGSGAGTTEFGGDVANADFGYDRIGDIEDIVEKEETERTELKLPEVGANELSCPICGFSLAGLSLQQCQVHANNCLDSPDIGTSSISTSSPSSTSTPEASSFHNKLHTNTTPSNSTSTVPITSIATSWSALFDQYKTKVTGIWSAKSAPALSDSDSGFWSRNGKKSCPFYKKLPGKSLKTLFCSIQRRNVSCICVLIYNYVVRPLLY